MQKIEVLGNVGADAEVKGVNGNKFVSFRVAHSEKWKDEQGNEKSVTEWVDCIWNNHDSRLIPFIKAGAKVFVRGFLRKRVYSSMKNKRMECGITCVVTEIELAGGNSDTVPRQLIDMSNGSIVDVQKFYWLPVDTEKMKEDEVISYTDRQGRLYQMNKQGFVYPVQEEVNSELNSEMSEAKENGK